MKKQPDKIKVSAGEDLLAFIPHIVGYWPEASVVCIGMAGKQLRATMRLDLPEDANPHASQVAALAASQLASDPEADGCLVAIFASVNWSDPHWMPHAGLYQELAAALAQNGLPVKDSWFVGTTHWRSISCTEEACCPWPGKENTSIKESFVNAEFIYRGSLVRELPQDQIPELTAVRDLEFVGAVAEAGKELRDELAVFGSGAHQLAATLGAWEHGLSHWPATPDASLTAFLLASLGSSTVRDAVMVALATTARHSLMGAIGLGVAQPDECQEVLVPRTWYGGNQANCCTVASCCPVVLAEDVKEAFLTAVDDFSKVLVGDITGPRSARDLATQTDNKMARRGAGNPKQPSKKSPARAARQGNKAQPHGPDWERLDRAEPLLQFLARATQGPDRAPVLCILGWIQWCKGRGTWAGHYFAACHESQPGYTLAGLLDQLLAVGYIAECAKNRHTAWQGYGASDKAAQSRSDVA